ncbi:hypothetical protein PPL_09372 [Heterostelium album PN500]|uniref:Uncharacterized protein n=1 Tax=Heterostelium pallidum (strain ATCC 26659 / Pp 5 / PN500) TaxID=670386 RepID=D3BLD8_HETP5|nr:hypothetical protein PPL_09372 [Heterostelium album PN500]EFA77872.1 hypothetical protein PPL_09372 [Heterostelium album PN500]|eukprot:XP_020430000.1 hypothetical protein PPL_09372 [Heterostelium album PN500]
MSYENITIISISIERYVQKDLYMNQNQSSLDNSDKICLSLTCKKLYNEKDGYLVLITPPSIHDFEHLKKRPFFNMKDYTNVVQKSYEQRGNANDLPNITPRVSKPNELFEVGVIPVGTTKLVFGDEFDRQLEPNSIPSSVISIVFGANFNQPIRDGDLPVELLASENHALVLSNKLDGGFIEISNFKNGKRPLGI